MTLANYAEKQASKKAFKGRAIDFFVDDGKHGLYIKRRGNNYANSFDKNLLAHFLWRQLIIQTPQRESYDGIIFAWRISTILNFPWWGWIFPTTIEGHISFPFQVGWWLVYHPIGYCLQNKVCLPQDKPMNNNALITKFRDCHLKIWKCLASTRIPFFMYKMHKLHGMQLHLIVILTWHLFCSHTIIVDNTTMNNSNIMMIEYKRLHRNAPVKIRLIADKVKANNDMVFDMLLMPELKEVTLIEHSPSTDEFWGWFKQINYAHKQGEKSSSKTTHNANLSAMTSFEEYPAKSVSIKTSVHQRMSYYDESKENNVLQSGYTSFGWCNIIYPKWWRIQCLRRDRYYESFIVELQVGSLMQVSKKIGCLESTNNIIINCKRRYAWQNHGCLLMLGALWQQCQ